MFCCCQRHLSCSHEGLFSLRLQLRLVSLGEAPSVTYWWAAAVCRSVERWGRLHSSWTQQEDRPSALASDVQLGGVWCYLPPRASEKAVLDIPPLKNGNVAAGPDLLQKPLRKALTRGKNVGPQLSSPLFSFKSFQWLEGFGVEEPKEIGNSLL